VNHPQQSLAQASGGGVCPRRQAEWISRVMNLHELIPLARQAVE
jgi:hypothetical protein